MKKFFTVALVALFAAVSAHAQIGVTAGLTSSSTTLQSAANDLQTGAVNQYHVGVVYKLGIGNILAIQPGILYNVKGSSFNLEEVTNTTLDFKTGFLEVPVQIQAGLGIGNIARVYALAEPFVGYAISNQVTGAGLLQAVVNSEDTWNMVKSRFEYGIALGAGVEVFRHLQVSVKYFWNFNTLYGVDNETLENLVQAVSNIDKTNVGGIALTATVLF